MAPSPLTLRTPSPLTILDDTARITLGDGAEGSFSRWVTVPHGSGPPVSWGKRVELGGRLRACQLTCHLKSVLFL